MKTLLTLLLSAACCWSATVTNLSISGNVSLRGAIVLSNYVPPQAAAPTFTPDGGATGVEVTIATATTGATVHASTNDFTDEVTGTTSVALTPIYAGTIKAYATKTGYTTSTTNTSSAYTEPACDVVTDQQPASDSGYSMYKSDRVYMAWEIWPTNSFTACKVDAWFSVTGSPTNNVYVQLRNDNSGSPGTLIDESSPVQMSTILSGTWIPFTGVSASITANQKAWLVIRADNAYSDNFVAPQYKAGSTNDCYFSANGTSWTLNSGTTYVRYRLYGN